MSFSEIIEKIDGFLWGWPLIILLFGTHIFMTFRTGFIQKDIFKAIKLSVTKDPDVEGDVSQFGALTTALSSTIGTGNIIGVGTAIALGGPGAVLWMWLTGIFGIATKYAETLISVKYRVKSEDGSMIGGAMYALDRGLNQKILGIIFAFLAAVCAFGIGCMVQANAIVTNIRQNFSGDEHTDKMIMYGTAIFLCVVVGLVILGGIKSITKVSERLVPFMAIFYIVGCLAILVMNADVLGETVLTIINSAVTTKAAGGGFVGSTVALACRYGFARGLFSNESGMGSAPLVASAAQTRNPKRQALVSMTGTFWDTVVVCLMTGLVLVSSIIKNPGIDALSGNGSELTSLAFGRIPVIGVPILVIGLITFSFSTILGWYYYGERCAVYLFGEKVIIIYKCLWVAAVFVGSVVELNLIWNIADLFNGLMAIPNIIAVLLLSDVIAKETQKYSGEHLEDKDETEIPTVRNSQNGVLL
ncbi:alanine or glycine:cation symporter, AGCS family [Butyrivibrio hungatei DSM 14810]|uniref:Alanine or glycine:cation symporter, AGCS family n=1 Tax=Butyrivibrio hungatei DSM 14810 TaxID=1121132 RepID=A0A1M7RXL4_9FIRM|nr:sodium:alanine symporter family protein [Butyrivibrio hungatei]SHN50888.1 alanine or glycine:cation symporter, AGCS family [Butyrivibrio hungatei DSM 14810]